MMVHTEHSSNNRSVCNQAACKRANVKITKGELRIGTNTLFNNDMEQRCQERVRLAFEEGQPVDKEFKDVLDDLAAVTPRYFREYADAQGYVWNVIPLATVRLMRLRYKADVSNRSAACRGAACSQKGTKVLKGELRLGILVNYDGEHASWYYKHWQCMSAYDLRQAKQRFDDEDDVDNTFDGIDALPVEYKQTVIDTLRTGKVISEPPQTKPSAPLKPKETQARKQKRVKVTESSIKDDDGNEDEGQVDEPKPKRTHKKRAREEMGKNEVEYVPRKTRSRQAKME
ncbi:hypothetical protein J1614_003485 [Plenodomus biglobosus]|nr:hypothetical protein J1614_003485 [Plenodomus biglobosus]